MVQGNKRVLIGLVVVLIIVMLFFPVYLQTQAQTQTAITPQDNFSIPNLNGSIHFIVNGSCSKATLQNDTWVFTDLKLNNFPSTGTLKFSAENSNITIYYYRTSNQFGRTTSFKYFAEGQGKQSINLGLNTTQKTSPSEWLITIPNGGIVVEGLKWTLLPDNTIVLNGLTGNVTVSHFNYTLPSSTGPFYVQHSIAIITAAVVAATIAIALVIKFKARP